jgi:hypothetical protein
MSFPKTVVDDKVTYLAATAVGTATFLGIYMLHPEIGAFTVTTVASLVAFTIGRAFSSRNLLGSMLPLHGRTGFYQTAPVAIRKRPRWLAPIPMREQTNGNFQVEDWQNGEYA